eukprot:905591-Amphidinium_carterae.1
MHNFFFLPDAGRAKGCQSSPARAALRSYSCAVQTKMFSFPEYGMSVQSTRFKPVPKSRSWCKPGDVQSSTAEMLPQNGGCCDGPHLLESPNPQNN